MMDHISQRDWNSTKNLYDRFVDERGIDNCVVERIIRNKFWDPMISSDEEEPTAPIDFDSMASKQNSRESRFRRFVPGYRKLPPHPKLSSLSQVEHRQCIKVLSSQNERILPHEFVGKPAKSDWRIFEDIQEKYKKEMAEYIEWARHLWTTTNCIRALRPKPLIELVYEAEYKTKTHAIQSFPKSFQLAAQIPLRAENHACEIVIPKTDLIKVNISKLPLVSFPNIYECRHTILEECPIPEPCNQHPCKFILPNETEVSMLPLTMIHQELAQFAVENGSEFVASEDALRCLLETDRTWSLPLSVCELIGPDGDKTNIIVVGSEYPEKKAPAPMRSYRAFRHMLQHAFTSKTSKSRTVTEHDSKMSIRSEHVTNPRNVKKASFLAKGAKVPGDQRTAVAYNNAVRAVATHQDSDSDDEDRLEIVIDDDSQNTSKSDNENDNNMTDLNDTNEDSTKDQPRKILKARHRLSVDKKCETEDMEVEKICQIGSQESVTNSTSQEGIQKDQESSKEESQSANQTDEVNGSLLNTQEEHFEITLPDCVCKDTEFEVPSPRSYKNVVIKNNTTKDRLNVIVHSSHKLRNEMSYEVLLEPILEYMLDIGGTLPSPHKLNSLAFSLMLRRKADLATVRVDGITGEVVTIDTMNLREHTAQYGDSRPDIANTLYTALSQLAGLLPGAYILKHEPSHGVNALLFSRTFGGAGVPLLAPEAALTPAEEARLVHTAPRLMPVLLPMHKYHRQLPLAFTYNMNQVAKEIKSTGKKNTPPAAFKSDSESGGKKSKWPKKKGKKGKTTAIKQ